MFYTACVLGRLPTPLHRNSLFNLSIGGLLFIRGKFCLSAKVCSEGSVYEALITTTFFQRTILFNHFVTVNEGQPISGQPVECRKLSDALSKTNFLDRGGYVGFLHQIRLLHIMLT